MSDLNKTVDLALNCAHSACAVTLAYLAYRLWSLDAEMRRNKVLAVVSAHGKSLPQTLLAWENAKMSSKFNHVVVATGDMKIANGCRSFGADVIVTSESCKNGFECCIEALKIQEEKYGMLKYRIAINIQGEAFHMEPKLMNDIVKVQIERATLTLKNLESLGIFSGNWMKCVDLQLHENGYKMKVVNGALEDIEKKLLLRR